MSKVPPTPYRDSTDLPRPPPSYGPAITAVGSSEPLLGEDRGQHSDDDIPDDFKYDPYVGLLSNLDMVLV